MFDAYLGFVVVILATLVALWFLLMYRKTRATLGVCLLMVMIGTMVGPAPVSALEVRRDAEVVTIARSETIDDTVLVAAETVLIEGVITGDLVAVGRRIDISGSVEGNVLTFAESVTVSGKVGGFALGAASSYDLRGATVGGDLWVAREMVGIDSNTRVERNVTIAAQSTSVEGYVAKDLYAFAETVELSGDVGEDLEAFASRVRLLGEAHVGGNVRFRSGNEDRLHRAATVRVDGEVEFLDMPEGFETRNRYATIEFYLWQVARLIAALLAGVALLWFVPGYRSMSIGAGAGVDAFKTAGVGFLIMVSVPIMAVLVAFTLVGLPLSIIAIAAWLLSLYLAKIVVGALVSRMLLSQRGNFLWTLLVGLTIVIVAVNLPFIGSIINLVLTIVGLGLIAQHLIAILARPDSGDLAPG
ncbi:MAG: polymer-forming cytoskeletal protein [Pseudomonadales bacterium]